MKADVKWIVGNVSRTTSKMRSSLGNRILQILNEKFILVFFIKNKYEMIFMK